MTSASNPRTRDRPLVADASDVYSSVRNLAIGIRRAMARHDDSATVYVFGSGRKRALGAAGDIDLLVLQTREAEPFTFAVRLGTLRGSLLCGRNDCGFDLGGSELANAPTQYLARRSTRKLRFVPRFVFGPMRAVPAKIVGVPEVIVHFKGPISPAQFNLFREALPFHARSIAGSAVHIAGPLKLTPIGSLPAPCASELAVWVNSLELRIRLYDDPVDLRKCIRKLVTLYAVAHQWSETEQVGRIAEACELGGTSAAGLDSVTDVVRLVTIFERARQCCDLAVARGETKAGACDRCLES